MIVIIVIQAGYDKFLHLQTSSSQADKPKIFVPQHAAETGPLSESFMAGRHGLMADMGLVMNGTFRVGFGNNWSIASSGDGLDTLDLGRAENEAKTFYNYF